MSWPAWCRSHGTRSTHCPSSWPLSKSGILFASRDRLSDTLLFTDTWLQSPAYRLASKAPFSAFRPSFQEHTGSASEKILGTHVSCGPRLQHAGCVGAAPTLKIEAYCVQQHQPSLPASIETEEPVEYVPGLSQAYG